jgi:hypothetical protein
MSEWLIQESLKRDEIIFKMKLWIALLTSSLVVVSGALIYMAVVARSACGS